MIERITDHASAARARVVLFDFDGTVSLIRSGWVDVMVPMMVEILAGLKTGESEADLTAIVEDFVGRLTGKQTIYQMMALCDEIKKRGGQPEEPLVYKHRYLDLLWTRIKDRVESLEKGDARAADYLVPGVLETIQRLRQRGLTLYLASGTDEVYMRREADLLGISSYFDGGVFGAQDDYTKFEKDILIRDIIRTAGVKGEEFLGFGDGYVEIQNVKEVGGVAVGVATEEPACQNIDPWKRQRLVGVGADYIIPNFLEHVRLFDMLFAG